MKINCITLLIPFLSIYALKRVRAMPAPREGMAPDDDSRLMASSEASGAPLCAKYEEYPIYYAADATGLEPGGDLESQDESPYPATTTTALNPECHSATSVAYSTASEATLSSTGARLVWTTNSIVYYTLSFSVHQSSEPVAQSSQSEPSSSLEAGTTIMRPPKLNSNPQYSLIAWVAIVSLVILGFGIWIVVQMRRHRREMNQQGEERELPAFPNPERPMAPTHASRRREIQAYFPPRSVLLQFVFPAVSTANGSSISPAGNILELVPLPTPISDSPYYSKPRQGHAQIQNLTYPAHCEVLYSTSNSAASYNGSNSCVCSVSSVTGVCHGGSDCEPGRSVDTEARATVGPLKLRANVEDARPHKRHTVDQKKFDAFLEETFEKLCAREQEKAALRAE